jgi:S1-C subfamily serine protease
MGRSISNFLLDCLLAGSLPAAQATSIDDVRKSVVRITTASQDPNWREPWSPGRVQRGRGAGFVIEGKRILTNAHVVSNARFVAVERENDPKKYPATVEHIAHDCDLAVLKVLDAGFFNNAVALGFGGIPELESTVSVYGYPIGGDRLSVTRGVVSRVDFESYSHTGVDSHLAVQIDAAINPGNSGGPVLQEGKVVGVAFQGYSGAVAQNVGYMIPTPVIRRLLKDIEDGRYDRYMELLMTTFPLRNTAHRRALGLPDDDRGIVVCNVVPTGPSAGVLQRGDVLLAIDGHPITSDGFVELEGERVEMGEVVERKFKGDQVRFAVLRDRQPREVTVTLRTDELHRTLARAYDVPVRYIVFAGLLLQPMNRDLIEAHSIEDVRVRYFFRSFIADELYRQHPEVIILSNILPDPINTHLGEFKSSILDEINGVKVRTLREAAEALAKPVDYHVLKFIGKGRPAVLNRRAVEEACERIKTRYNVQREQNLSEEVVR